MRTRPARSVVRTEPAALQGKYGRDRSRLWITVQLENEKKMRKHGRSDRRGAFSLKTRRLQTARSLMFRVADPRIDREGSHLLNGIRHQQGMKGSGIGAGVEPQRIRCRVKDDRHPVVHGPHQVVRFGVGHTCVSSRQGGKRCGLIDRSIRRYLRCRGARPHH